MADLQQLGPKQVAGHHVRAGLYTWCWGRGGGGSTAHRSFPLLSSIHLSSLSFSQTEQGRHAQMRSSSGGVGLGAPPSGWP